MCVPRGAVHGGSGREGGRGRARGERRSGEESHSRFDVSPAGLGEKVAVLVQPETKGLCRVGPALGNLAVRTATPTPSPGGSPAHPATCESERAARSQLGLDGRDVRSRVGFRGRGGVRRGLDRAKSRGRGGSASSRSGGGRRARGRGLADPDAPKGMNQARRAPRNLEPKWHGSTEPEDRKTMRELFCQASKSAHGARSAKAPAAHEGHVACRERAQRTRHRRGQTHDPRHRPSEQRGPQKVPNYVRRVGALRTTVLKKRSDKMNEMKKIFEGAWKHVEMGQEP